MERYHAMPDGAPVAVRSSATAEDLAFASFAGQQDTYLNVVGADALIEAVRRCWASLWTDRAVSYRSANGIDHAQRRLAVVVQQMVDATAAGVMFTANPLTGTRHQAVIDASPGLGEAVVSGAVNPDHYVVDTDDRRRSSQRRRATSGWLIRGRPGGGTERIERADQSEPRLPRPMTRCWRWPGSAAGRSALRRPAGHRVGAGRRRHLLADPGPTDHHALPAARAPPQPGDAAVHVHDVAQGLTRPLTPMGLASLPAGRHLGRHGRGRPPADPRAGPLGLAGRPAAPVRRRHRRSSGARSGAGWCSPCSA